MRLIYSVDCGWGSAGVVGLASVPQSPLHHLLSPSTSLSLSLSLCLRTHAELHIHTYTCTAFLNSHWMN